MCVVTLMQDNPATNTTALPLWLSLEDLDVGPYQLIPNLEINVAKVLPVQGAAEQRELTMSSKIGSSQARPS